ncbi:unnamed protein product [Candidula unifasciata]|uniref:Peptidase S1 domain-containing protein n=1 Tax=Candidula unifasciata TaxID=100452 RepID=A0A8S3ZU49_9EUPU|nr:unnamed protein product [Candidula unifasciata]
MMMTFTFPIMKLACLLVTVVLVSTVIGRGVDKRTKEESILFMEDNPEMKRRNEAEVKTTPKVTAKPTVSSASTVTPVSNVNNKPKVVTEPKVTTETDSTAEPNVKTTRKLTLNGRHICGQRPAIRSKRHAPNRPSDIAKNPDGVDKVLGGIITAPGDVPWHVSIYSDTTYLCGGALLSQHWIVTTTNCVGSPFIGNLSVVVGDRILEADDPGEQTFNVSNVVLHQNYTVGSFAYDIALLKIELVNNSGIEFNKYVQPICLPRTGEVVYPGERLAISGLGNIFGGNTSVPPLTVLEKGEIEGISHKSCQERLPYNLIESNMECANRVPSFSPSCRDDLGEATTMQLGGSRVLIGLVTPVSGCSNLMDPVVLTKVIDFVLWIDKMTVIHGDKIDTIRLDGSSY